ncbi:unnamed protein product [Paramecium pentaurelia]|uniref:Uncharacterized protein n=1 Tax=Paramecium pentaurelia TaxID=43138 RepID=A0A8S1TM11_9CILI|nr:unnamed protein product [Paramecium pentaurelia]
MQQEDGKQVTVYTAYQNKQLKVCYDLETSNSMKILRSIKKVTTIANICEDNLSNLNMFIDRTEIDIYVKEIQNQRQIKPTLQQLLNELQIRMTELQNLAQMEQEQNQSDNSDDWQPDDEQDDEDDSSQQQ